MTSSLAVSSLSDSASLRTNLPPWAQDVLDSPTSDSESGETDDSDEDIEPRSDDSYEAECGNGEDSDAVDPDLEHSSEDEERESCSSHASDDASTSVASSGADYDLLVERNPIEAVALLRTLFDDRLPGARNREFRDLLSAVERATCIKLVNELREHGTGLSEPGVLNEPYYIKLAELCGHIIDSHGLFDEHPVCMDARRCRS